MGDQELSLDVLGWDSNWAVLNFGATSILLMYREMRLDEITNAVNVDRREKMTKDTSVRHSKVLSNRENQQMILSSSQ